MSCPFIRLVESDQTLDDIVFFSTLERIGGSIPQVLARIAIAEQRLTKDRRDLLKAMNDPNIEPKRLSALIQGYNLASNLTLAISKIHEDLLPRIFAERSHLTFDDFIHVTNENGKAITLAQYKKILQERDKREEEEEQNLIRQKD